MNTNNNTSTDILSIPWIVAPKIVIIPGDSAPTFNAPAAVEERRMMNVANGRDADGKYAPQEKPLTTKAAKNKLNKLSQKRNAAIDRMMEMENW